MKKGEKTVMQKLRLDIQSYCGDQLFIDIYQKLFDKYLELEIEQINDVYNRGKENAPLNFEWAFIIPNDNFVEKVTDLLNSTERLSNQNK